MSIYRVLTTSGSDNMCLVSDNLDSEYLVEEIDSRQQLIAKQKHTPLLYDSIHFPNIKDILFPFCFRNICLSAFVGREFVYLRLFWYLCRQRVLFGRGARKPEQSV